MASMPMGHGHVSHSDGTIVTSTAAGGLPSYGQSTGISHPPTVSTAQPVTAAGGAPPPGQVQQQQPAAPKELNAAMLCRFGLETVQEIVARSVELFQILKAIQPPDGKINIGIDRKIKFQETLKNIKANFKRLRVIYEKIEESFPSSREIPFEEEILNKTDDSSVVDEKRNTETYKQAVEEYKEVTEHVMIKNRALKDAIDHLRTMIWDVNTMLAMRKE